MIFKVSAVILINDTVLHVLHLFININIKTYPFCIQFYPFAGISIAVCVNIYTDKLNQVISLLS